LAEVGITALEEVDVVVVGRVGRDGPEVSLLYPEFLVECGPGLGLRVEDDVALPVVLVPEMQLRAP
jgi:hypothetical protein